MLYLLTCISSLQVSLSRHEDPMAEFDDDPATLDSELQDLVPSLHPEDTPHIPYRGVLFNEDEMVKRSKEFYQLMKKRRSVRHYSSKSVPKEVVENIIHTAGKYVGVCACTVLIVVWVTVVTDCANIVLSATDWCVDYTHT